MRRTLSTTPHASSACAEMPKSGSQKAESKAMQNAAGLDTTPLPNDEKNAADSHDKETAAAIRTATIQVDDSPPNDTACVICGETDTYKHWYFYGVPHCDRCKNDIFAAAREMSY